MDADDASEMLIRHYPLIEFAVRRTGSGYQLRHFTGERGKTELVFEAPTFAELVAKALEEPQR